jgi:hypothetical protein
MPRLRGSHAEELRCLVTEIDALGLQPDPTVVLQMLDRLDSKIEVLDERARLQSADVESVCSILINEPPRLIARVLKSGPWRWQQAVLARLDAAKLGAVKNAMASRAPEKLDATIIECFAASWVCCPGRASASNTPAGPRARNRSIWAATRGAIWAATRGAIWAATRGLSRKSGGGE